MPSRTRTRTVGIGIGGLHLNKKIRCKYLLLLQFVLTMTMSHFLSGGNVIADAFLARSVSSTRNSNSFQLHNKIDDDDNLVVELDDPRVVSSRVFDGTDKRPIILFDGVCNLCNNAVNLALDWDPSARLRFSALQSNVGRSLLEANGRSADDISSIVLVTRDGAYVKSDAVLKITEELTPSLSLLLFPLRPLATAGRLLLPRVLRDAIYDNVADNRYRLMGKRNECRFDADGEFEDRFVNDDIALVLKKE